MDTISTVKAQEKPTLRFHKDGHFRVLEVSDMHAGEHVNPKMMAGLEALLAETNPDFVMLCGDQCLPAWPFEQRRAYFMELIAPILKRGLPFGTVFGNHDREKEPTNDMKRMKEILAEEQAMYETVPGCLSTAGPAWLPGVGNYNIPVLAHDSDVPAFLIWGLDSHREIDDLTAAYGVDAPHGRADYIWPHRFTECGNNGMPLFSQVMWYFQTSVEAEQKAGKKVPGIMFLHNPLPEYTLVCRNPEQSHARGNKRDTIGNSELNSGLFSAALERGDIRGFFFGHEHLIDLEGQYLGITLACDGAIGYNMSTHDDMRGGRVIDLYEDGKTFTRQISLMSLMGQEAMRDPDYFEGGSLYNIRVVD